MPPRLVGLHLRPGQRPAGEADWSAADGRFSPDDVLSFADLAVEVDRRLFRSLVSNPSHVLSRHLPAIKTTNYNLCPNYIFAPGPMVSPSQKRILLILSLGCFLKGFIVINFLVWGLPGFLTYLRFVYIFPNSLY